MWIGSFAFFCAFGSLLFLHEHAFWTPDAPIWPGIATSTATQWLPFAPLTPFVFHVSARVLRVTEPMRSVLVALLVGAVATLFTLASFGVQRTLIAYGFVAPQRLDETPLVEGALDHLGRSIPFTSLHALAIVGVALLAAHRRRERREAVLAERMRTDLIAARLSALKSQLEPHFLFNTLHAVGIAARTDPTSATRMTTLLGDLLRSHLDERDTQEVALEHEVARLDPYLEIQKIRFGDRIVIDVDIEAGVRGARVPSQALLPLVENAIRHGIERCPGTRRIEIRARRDGDRLTLGVDDDGEDPPAAADLVEGIGIGNTRRRIDALYGTAGELTLERRQGGGASVRLKIPFAQIEEGTSE